MRGKSAAPSTATLSNLLTWEYQATRTFPGAGKFSSDTRSYVCCTVTFACMHYSCPHHTFYFYLFRFVCFIFFLQQPINCALHVLPFFFYAFPVCESNIPCWINCRETIQMHEYPHKRLPPSIRLVFKLS
jgi:hypothetical protein